MEASAFLGFPDDFNVQPTLGLSAEVGKLWLKSQIQFFLFISKVTLVKLT